MAPVLKVRSPILILILIAGALVGCARDGSPADTTTVSESATTPTNRIDIPSTVRANLGITFASVERRRVDRTMRVPGAFELQPLARREYRMTLPGHVEIIVDQYDAVDVGDVLYRFRSPEWPEIQHEIIVGVQQIESARAEVEVARSRIDEAQQRLDIRRQRLAALAEADFKQAILEAEAAELAASLPRLRAEYRVAETSVNNAERLLEHALHRASSASGISESELTREVTDAGQRTPAYRSIEWIEVRANKSGLVEALAVTNGAYVDAPAIVLSTVDPQMVRFKAVALQADLERLSDRVAAMIVRPTVEGGDAARAGVPSEVMIGLEARPDQRTVDLIAAPAEVRSWMRPGVSAFLEVVVGSSGGPALAIPRAAVAKDGIVHVFFRRDPRDPNKVIRVEADLGESDGRWVVVQSGLGLGDEVVLDGVYELNLASQQRGSTPVGGHFHADGTFHHNEH